jgi:hypothetical protein
MTENKHTPGEVRRWSYSINYGPDGQEDWAYLIDPEGRCISNIRTHDAIAISKGMNLAHAIAFAEAKHPGAFWMLGKGRVSAAEKLYGFQVLFGTDEIIAVGEGDTAADAIFAISTSEAPHDQ